MHELFNMPGILPFAISMNYYTTSATTMNSIAHELGQCTHIYPLGTDMSCSFNMTQLRNPFGSLSRCDLYLDALSNGTAAD